MAALGYGGYYFGTQNTETSSSSKTLELTTTPIQKGDQIAKLQISFADKSSEFPLFSGEDIEQKNFFSRIFSAIYYIILGSN